MNIDKHALRKQQCTIVCAGLLLAFVGAWGGLIVLAQGPGTSTVHLTPQRTFTTAEKMNPQFWLGNADDPLPPADYLIGDPQRVDKWYWRNPLHNFTFYVIGIADKEFDRRGRLPADVFDESGGVNYAVCEYGFLRLPFISYKSGKFQCYWGWRSRGNFGIKFNI